MTTRYGQELDLTRLMVIVLFLIVGGLFGRMFFHNYISEPARRVGEKLERAEKYRTRGLTPDLPQAGARSEHYPHAILF